MEKHVQKQDGLAAKIPAYTQKILRALADAGYEAYLAGGAVRDLLLGRAPEDYDVTTSARPEEVLAVCRKNNWQVADNLGRNFGCVLALVDGVPTEITTFRGERYDDADMHRPAATWFCATLREDLSRRDFTINAMALDIKGNLYDYCGGRQDLRARLIRPVGKASLRYQEDALRMLRACRFVAQLGFAYVQDGEALPACGMKAAPYYLEKTYPFPAERCAGLSLERVRAELEKTLLGAFAGRGLMLLQAAGILAQHCRVRENGRYENVPILPEARHLLGLAQNPRFHLYDAWEHTLAAIDLAPRDLAIRWSLLLHDLGKGLAHIRKIKPDGQPSDPGHEAESAAMAAEILRRLRYPQSFCRTAAWLVAQHMRFAPLLRCEEKTLRRWVLREAESGIFRTQAQLADAYAKLVQVFLADIGATCAGRDAEMMRKARALGEEVLEIARSSMPVAGSDLALRGQEMLEFVAREFIQAAIAYLRTEVRRANLPNEHDALLAALRKKAKRENWER